jgi:hypothetical protein
MWERADGIRTPRCADSDHRLTLAGRGALRLGLGWRALLRGAGQPQQRTRAWSWCVGGKRNVSAADVAELSRAGKVELVGSTARGRSAGGVLVGARSKGNGVVVRRSWVYAVRGGRVRAVAVASRALLRRPRALRVAMGRVLTAKASARARKFVPNPAASAAGRPTGKPLAGTSDPRLNAALIMLCNLQVGGTN